MNWKHGGTISDNNDIKYTIRPVKTRPPPPKGPVGHCDAKNRVLFYSWNVWGGGFASSDYGQSKGALKDQISGCGAVTRWKFEYVSPGEDGVEWHASGTLPITISNHCLAKAVKSAGGFESNC